MSTGIPVWNKSVRSFASASVSPRMEASFEAYQVAGITVNRSLVVKLCLKSLDAFIYVHILIHVFGKNISLKASSNQDNFKRITAKVLFHVQFIGAIVRYENLIADDK